MARRRGATPRRRPGSARGPRRGASARSAPRYLELVSPAKLALYLVCAAILAVAADLIYQVARKPTELLFPVSGWLYKTPEETWRAYASLFRRNATARVSAAVLAALAQQEGSGNPLVRTYWRWSWPALPYNFYRPASSAVGMYQITDPTFEEARHYCIHAHALAREGAWDDWHSCWFNAFYMRVVPADAVELTAAYLDLKVGVILANNLRGTPTALQLQHLAAVVHLCGAGAGDLYARRGFRFSAAQRCGDHDPREYLERIDGYSREFTRLAAREAPGAQ